MSFKVFLLLLVIAVCGVFIYLKVETLGPDTSSFNQTTRYKLGLHPVLRNMLGLHKDGDARAEYLTGSNPLVVEIVSSSGSHMTQDAINLFVAKISQYISRQVVVYNVDTIKSGQLNSQDLDNIEHGFRRHLLPGQANLFIIYADDFIGGQYEVGRTYQEYGMVLSDQKLVNAAGTSPYILNQYIASTMLHEFGHQLGLQHVDNSNCIMSADVENPSPTGSFTAAYTPTSFCPQELDMLNNIKKSLAQ